jgi:D-sedoheptulose 7-phosphate isomerase
MTIQKDHINQYFQQVKTIAELIDKQQIKSLANALVNLREKGGRLFLLGVGGSAANCSHAVNDFRKLCGIEAYAPTDNVSELTARINDEGWDGALAAWLQVSRIESKDALFILSVGGGNLEKQVSVNLIKAIDIARERKAKVFGIVGRDGGYTKQLGDQVVLVPTVDDKLITPHSEAFQAVIWHCLVSYPALQIQATKW